jgi:hypothetical protein
MGRTFRRLRKNPSHCHPESRFFRDEGSAFVLVAENPCRSFAEFTLSGRARFFAEFTLSQMKRILRYAQDDSEGLRMTAKGSE